MTLGCTTAMVALVDGVWRGTGGSGAMSANGGAAESLVADARDDIAGVGVDTPTGADRPPIENAAQARTATVATATAAIVAGDDSLRLGTTWERVSAGSAKGAMA